MSRAKKPLPAKPEHLNRTDINQAGLNQLAIAIRSWGRQLGFQQVGFSDIDLAQHETYLQQWLQQHYHGEMDYMARHGTRRSRPQELVPGTLRIISVRMDYLAADIADTETVLHDSQRGVISRYALGRDYHKLIRKRLQRLADKISDHIGDFGYRAFVDSAPVLEKALAQKAGLGWIGKHTNLIHRQAGSWFFLGEIYTDLPLPVDEPATEHCGDCTACIDVCPTQAIIAPYRLDARRCIAYLTIELRGSIPLEFRPLIGNRVFGCDDCQLVCPWNRFAQTTVEADFAARHGLDNPSLLTLFSWSETEFMQYTEGSAIRRIGYQRWLRNIAVGLGNHLRTRPLTARPADAAIIAALQARRDDPSALVREHVQWALDDS